MTRKTISLIAAGVGALFMTAGAWAQSAGSYPSRPVRWIVPFAPGASNDITARLLAQKMTESLGQQFVVDNRPGAGGSIGAGLVATATPDGYTLLHANPGPSVNNVILRKRSSYKMEDFAPVVFIGYVPLIIVATPSLPANNIKEFVTYAKANPGKVTWASSGLGSSLHIGLALFQAASGVDVVHVPYKGTAPALLDVVPGRVQVMHTTTVSAATHIKANRVKVLGVAGPERQAVQPNVATLEEQGVKNAEATVWFGVQVPAKTPQPIIAKLNAELNKTLKLPDVKQKLDQLGLIVKGGSPQDFAAFMKTEADRLQMLIKTKRVEMIE